LAAVALAALLVAVGPSLPAAEGAHPIVFTDIGEASGIHFVHDMGKTEAKYMVETMGSGGGLLDYDLDGDLDIYLLNGAPMPAGRVVAGRTSALLRNDAGRFTDVTARAGTPNLFYGMGMCVGDYDNDGFPDLYLANYGPNVLYRNNGDGTFTDQTAAAGVGHPGWGSSCVFFDAEGDGDIDLYIVNYVIFQPSDNKFCGDVINRVRTYCHPNVYTAQRDLFYRNDGDGSFTEAADLVGMTSSTGNGLGVTAGDYDNDGDVDLYLANDKSPNILYRNDGGVFTDVTLLAGVGYGLDGSLQAGMGTDFGDYDGDGDLDIVVTNLDFENNGLYRNDGNGVFSDVSFPSGIGGISLSFVGFGALFADYDNDGLLDLLIANGHILDNASYFNDATSYAQRNFVHRNLGGGRFEEIGLKLGPDMARPNVGRGLSTGDLDHDGDLDFLVTISGGSPRLLRNDGASSLPSFRLRLYGTASSRDALGARVTASAGGRTMIREVRSGSSYQSQSEMDVHFGLGDAPRIDTLTVRWLSGRVDTFKGVDPGSALLVEGDRELSR
jgi:hypothetical protein